MKVSPNTRSTKYSLCLLWLTLLCWGLVNFTTVVCFAQPVQPIEQTNLAAKSKAWQMEPSITFYQQYSDNVDLKHEDIVSAWTYKLMPSLSLVRPSPRKQMKIKLDLKIDHRDKENDEKETLYWANLGGYVQQETSPRTAYEFEADFNLGYTQTNVGTPYTDVFNALDRTKSFSMGPSIRYKLSRTALAKASYMFTNSRFHNPDLKEKDEHNISLYLQQKIGSRVSADVSGIYSKKDFSDQTGYTDIMIPFGMDLDLTYLKLRLGGIYLIRDLDRNNSKTKRFGLQIGGEVGGKLLRLKSTSVDLTYNTNYYTDVDNDSYENKEGRLGIYHAYRKFDVYFYLSLGQNKYLQKADVDKDSLVEYYSLGGLWKWRINPLWNTECRIDYDKYQYKDTGRDYKIIRGTVETSYYVLDWLMAGISYRRTESTSNVDEGNYDENLYALFLRTVW